MDARKILIDNLLVYKKKNKKTQKDISEAAQISYRGYGKIERGEVSPTLDSLERIATAVDKSLVELLSSKDSDLAEVVRCWNCANYNRETGICTILLIKSSESSARYTHMEPDGFCSCGVKIYEVE